MPLYEYQCQSCKKRFEKIRKFSDPPLKKCDLCGKGPVTKLVSAPGIAFKGSGFYITDYAKGSSSASAPGGSTGSASKSEPKSDSSSDSKSESKTEKSETKSESKTDAKPAAKAESK